MLHTLKRRLYFVVASYFGFWARFVLRRWHPRIIVITGSSGKTTVLHLVEAQLGDRATYGHHANSAIGIPFHILGLGPNVGSKPEWILRVLKAPFHALHRPPKTKLYVVEADCDRPHEGEFISKLLKPEVVLWVSVYKTHSMNFDKKVKAGLFVGHEAAIAHEFGYFVEAARSLVLANADQPLLLGELNRAQSSASVELLTSSSLDSYTLESTYTLFVINGQSFRLNGLQPKELVVGLQMVNKLLTYLDLPIDPAYQQLKLPPGRSNVLRGRDGITIIDSTYNTGLGATMALLSLFRAYPNPRKWLIIGDILEQGSLEQAEHEQLAEEINKLVLERVILLGHRTASYTYPLLKKMQPDLLLESFDSPKAVLDYLNANLKGQEVLLFKGAQGLEGVIEQLLADPSDANLLVRREPSWVARRQAWGLPR